MTGDHTHKFPNDPVLVRLLIAASRHSSSEIVVHDVAGFEKSYPDLLSDILQTRHNLHELLPPSALTERGILREENQYVAILTRSGYEFLVAFFAIRAVGGVCVPLASGILPEEAEVFLSQVKSTSMLAGKDRIEKAAQICATVGAQGSVKSFVSIPISSDAKPQGNTSFWIDDTLKLDPEGPGLVMFTSGTTGRPKGVELPRQCLAYTRLAEPGSAAINYRPGHWLGGASSLVGSIVTGKKVYILGEKANAKVVLDAFRNHHITDATFSPLWLRQIQVLLTDQNGDISNEVKSKYSGCFKGLSTLRSSAAIIQPSTKQFWTDLTGLPFENVYAATELGGAAIRGIPKLKGSIGTPVPGVKVKLSEGTHGEICIKSPSILIRYIGDEALTQASFDEDGYFKTGDLGELKDGEYVFAGRENTDYVTFGSYRISTLMVENSLMDLPYISEACVVAVPNHSAKHLCAAIVRLRDESTPTEQITLARIRSDLESSLASYMMPGLLRILSDEDELPRTVSGKPIKRQILKDYFGSTDGFPPKDFPPGVQRFILPKKIETEIRPWDWGGMQCADEDSVV